VAVTQIRGGLPEGLRVGDGSPRRDRTLFPVLQSRAAAPESWLSDAGDGPLGRGTFMSGSTKRRKIASNESGTLSPNPWDLTLSRQNVWCTVEALERRIGLRRDATRAPLRVPEWQGAASMPGPPLNYQTDPAEY